MIGAGELVALVVLVFSVIGLWWLEDTEPPRRSDVDLDGAWRRERELFDQRRKETHEDAS